MAVENSKGWSRRQFLKRGGAATGVVMATQAIPLQALTTIPDIQNPLEHYPSRDWEQTYRDLYKPDSSYVFTCAPNDTHNCLLRAQVKNGVVVRISPTYGYGKATDIYGNKASHRWDPRCCQKGLTLGRRIYGERRVKSPMVRKGFLDWAKGGFQREADGRAKMNVKRGQDEWVKVSWDEAFDLQARGFQNIATTYGGPEGAEKLKQQGYDEAMIEAMNGVGTQTLKFRGGMPLLGALRVMGMYRLCNSMALLDANIRKVGADKAVGGRGWDNYSWHTDLPPGHTMVTGMQTCDFDLANAEYSKLITCWGMNWISTKMPDSHWLTEARLKGAKVVTITVEYQSTSSKADDVIVIRPGTDSALALGMAQVIMSEKLLDVDFVKAHTDLPLLVRLDTLETVKASDVFPDYKLAELKRMTLLQPGQKPPKPYEQQGQYMQESLRKEWDDMVIWDAKAKGPAPLNREDVGDQYRSKNVDAALTGTFDLKLKDGKTIKVRPIYDLIQEYVNNSFTPELTAKVTGTTAQAVRTLARDIAKAKEKTLFAVGMGPNHFFNNDLKDRAIFLVASLTRNVGFPGGNVGSYAGNYRGAYFNGLYQYIGEDPFDIEMDPAKPGKYGSKYKMESAHFYNYGDRPLRVGGRLFTGKGHLPTPTKSLMFCNGNSILGNLKWHHDAVVNTLPKIEMIAVQEWWWTASCEYADIVYPVDSWAEFKHADMTASVTNPFLQVYPRSPLKRIHDTKADIEVEAGVAKALGRLTGDKRFEDYFKFIHENRADVYLQRILDNGSATRGYKFSELEAKAKEGVPALLMTRTYPKLMGWEQSHESRPWYTRSGRLEIYRPEIEFKENGESLPVHREPIDGTQREPNVIVAKPHVAIKPMSPEDYGLKRTDLSCETRQVRNVLISPELLGGSKHPLRASGFTHVYITPKFRHGAHTTPVDTDLMAVWFGPFGDMYRRDKRMPWVGEGYVDINPEDGKKLGLADGDYVYVDGDPEDRPYRGWKKDTLDYKVHRALMRIRFYKGILPGVARSWFNMYAATYGSVKGAETRPDGLARNPATNYQAMFRTGSHQSATRAWLKPTLLTETLARKEYFGQVIGKGFAADIHCATGAPKESFVKFTKAEDGGMGGRGLWRPAQLGFRPGHESKIMQSFLAGNFNKKA